MSGSAIKVIASGVMKAIKEPENTGKIVLYIVSGIMVVFLIMGSIFSKLLNCFTGYSVSEDMDVTKTEAYVYCEDIVKEYHRRLERKMQFEEENFKILHSYPVVVEKVKEVNGKEVVERVREMQFDWQVDKSVNDISYAYIMAYMSTKYDIKSPLIWLHVDKEEVIKYLETIGELQCLPDEEYHIVYYYNNLLGLSEIAETCFDDSQEAEFFLQSFELYSKFLREDVAPQYHDTGLDIPHYFQNDFDTYRYGNKTISTHGSAPTCLAMVISYLKSNEISPEEVVEQAGSRYYIPGKDSCWDIFTELADNYEIECKDLGMSKKAVMEELKAGRPVIANMGNGKFTGTSHYIVLRGIKGSKFMVNDPNRNNQDKYKTDQFSMNLIFREGMNFWSFY